MKIAALIFLGMFGSLPFLAPRLVPKKPVSIEDILAKPQMSLDLLKRTTEQEIKE